MTIITSHPGKRPWRARKAFTLTELLIVMTITVVLSGAVFSSVGFVMRSSFAIANYTDMTSDGRRGLELFARDVREAQDLVDFSETSVTLSLAPQGGALYEVVYRYDPDAGVFERVEDGDVRVLMRGVRDDFRFARYNVLQEETGSNAEAKQLHLHLSMVRQVLSRDTTEKVISARYIMRNKAITH